MIQQDETLTKEFNKIMEKLAGVKVFGMGISSYDARIAIVAAYYLGRREEILAFKTAIANEYYSLVFGDTPKE